MMRNSVIVLELTSDCIQNGTNNFLSTNLESKHKSSVSDETLAYIQLKKIEMLLTNCRIQVRARAGCIISQPVGTTECLS